MRAGIAVSVASLLASSPVWAETPAQAPAPAPPRAYDAPPPPPPAPPAAAQPAPPALPPAPPAMPPSRTLPPPAAVGPSGVYVELRTSSPGVRIDRIVSAGTQVPVCTAPCRQVLPRNDIYVIDGDGMRQSSRFMLPDDRDQLTLDVTPGSSSHLAGGVVLAVLGFGAAYVGLLGLTANTIAGNDRGPSAAVLAGGLGVGIVGAYLIATAHTTVVSSTGAVFTRAPARPRKRSAVALTPRGLEF